MEILGQDISEYKKIDSEILAASRFMFKLAYYLHPFNEESEKDKFLSGKIQEPKFLYYPLDFDPVEIESKLNYIDFPNDLLGNLLKNKRKELHITNLIIALRGESEKVKRLSSELNGVPSKKLLENAEKILSEVRTFSARRDLDSEHAADFFKNYIQNLGLQEWQLQFSEKGVIEVNPVLKRLFIPRRRLFSKRELEKLSAHEIGVHVLRAENGYHQPFNIFALGLPGYLSTEEGLALYSEHLIGGKVELFGKAALVFAVNSCLEGKSFSECFYGLKERGFDVETSWKITLRVYRGGGFVKDHIYLQGWYEIQDFIKKNSDDELQKLYVGKVGFNDLKIVEKLMKEKILVKPKILPDFIKIKNELR